MNSIALPQRQILLPSFRLPAWVRNLKDERVDRIITQQGGLDKVIDIGDNGVEVESKTIARSTLVFDQLIDPNGTPLGSHTISPTNTPATSWTVNTGAMQITSNRATATGSSATGQMATVDAGQSDVTVTALVKPTTNSSAHFIGLIVRFQDTSNHWEILLNNNLDSFRIYDFNAGVATQRASVSVTIAQDTDYTMQVVLSGMSISATLNGANLISFSSSFMQTKTKHGLVNSNTTVVGNFGNLTITKP